MSSYSTDLVISKLANLNDTQESITSVSQWILFHRRAANETVQTWLRCLREADSAARKLNLIYLANDVAQQSRARKKDEFPRAFSPIMPEAMEIAYRGVTTDIQTKLRRVLDVWRQRGVFAPNVLGEIDQRLDAVDKAKTKGLTRVGGKSNGPAIPPELNSLISLHNTLSSLVTHAAQTQSTASTAYSSLLQSDHLPSPPIYLPRLGQLLKSLNESKEATLAVVKARTDLVKALESHLEKQRRELAKSQNILNDIEEQVKSVQMTRDEVHALVDGTAGTGMERSTTPDVEPPIVEALTPPPTTEELIKQPLSSMDVDSLAGLENLDPEIVALLKADMGLMKTTTKNGRTNDQGGVDGYAP